jgi:dihydropteroate synthase
MAVLNLTPDSFSDGGLWRQPEEAAEHALEMVACGADLLDLGAESTRPGGGIYGQGAIPVSAEEELDRLMPVLERLRARVSVPISVDTRKGVVARSALEVGADMINDVSALEDPDLAEAVARAGCPIVLMHSRGELPTMQRGIHFERLLTEVVQDLQAAVDRALQAGVARRRVFVDPGIGFGKTAEQNLALLRHLDALRQLDLPILVGASRKSFIGHVTGEPPDQRLPGSLAALAWAAHHGAAIVRVHDVAQTVQFLDVWQAIQGAES